MSFEHEFNILSWLDVCTRHHVEKCGKNPSILMNIDELKETTLRGNVSMNLLVQSAMKAEINVNSTSDHYEALQILIDI